jgi:hypothetical protein
MCSLGSKNALLYQRKRSICRIAVLAVDDLKQDLQELE